MHIEFHKIHLAYQAHEKHTQDEMHLKNYLVALISTECFPVAQMVEHGASNAKIMGSIPRESKS